jgi:hypothetical protein
LTNKSRYWQIDPPVYEEEQYEASNLIRGPFSCCTARLFVYQPAPIETPQVYETGAVKGNVPRCARKFAITRYNSRLARRTGLPK